MAEYINEQCRKCFHFQVCAQVMKNELFIREKLLKEENPKCEHFISSADVAEVRHGKWFLLDECANEGVYCSACHKKIYKVDYANQKLKSKYCPNCGARMDGDTE
ncbi:MAG: hypothetical protein ACI4XH_07925 [Acutalibacteraceae bacterium]